MHTGTVLERLGRSECPDESVEAVPRGSHRDQVVGGRFQLFDLHLGRTGGPEGSLRAVVHRGGVQLQSETGHVLGSTAGERERGVGVIAHGTRQGVTRCACGGSA